MKKATTIPDRWKDVISIFPLPREGKKKGPALSCRKPTLYFKGAHFWIQTTSSSSPVSFNNMLFIPTEAVASEGQQLWGALLIGHGASNPAGCHNTTERAGALRHLSHH